MFSKEFQVSYFLPTKVEQLLTALDSNFQFCLQFLKVVNEKIVKILHRVQD